MINCLILNNIIYWLGLIILLLLLIIVIGLLFVVMFELYKDISFNSIFKEIKRDKRILELALELYKKEESDKEESDNK